MPDPSDRVQARLDPGPQPCRVAPQLPERRVAAVAGDSDGTAVLVVGAVLDNGDYGLLYIIDGQYAPGGVRIGLGDVVVLAFAYLDPDTMTDPEMQGVVLGTLDLDVAGSTDGAAVSGHVEGTILHWELLF